MSKNHDVSDFILLGLVLGLITDIGQCTFSNITHGCFLYIGDIIKIDCVCI